MAKLTLAADYGLVNLVKELPNNYIVKIKGTMGPEPEIGKLEKEKGALYTLVGKHQVKTHLTKVSIANGLAWNVEKKKMYYIDSPRRTVDVYDFDIDKGEICKKIKINFYFNKY